MSDWSSDVCSSDLDWTPARSRRDLVHPDFGAVEAWNDAVHDTASGIVTYETHYRVASTGKHLAARSQLRFTPKEELGELIAEPGPHVATWPGAWPTAQRPPRPQESIPPGGAVPV